MKTLFLVRHAKAVSQESDAADIDRPLMKRGKKDAQNMARKVRKNAVVPQLIITSPARRAVKSARFFAKEFSFSPDTIVLNDLLYQPPEDAAESPLLDIVRNIDNRYQTVMIIGHDPLLSDFANFLQKSFTEKLTAAAVLQLEFPNRQWKNIAKDSATVKLFDYPGRKKEQWNKMETDLQGKIEAAIGRALSRVDKEIAADLGEPVRQTAKKIAKAFLKELKLKEKRAPAEKGRDKKEEKKKTEGTTPKQPPAGRKVKSKTGGQASRK
jgi:phosphohistidine phosphatase